MLLARQKSGVPKKLFADLRVQHYIRKTNIKMKRGGRNRIYNPRGLD